MPGFYEEAEKEKKSFWTPGGIAAMITAITGLVTMLFAVGILQGPAATPTPVSGATLQHNAASATDPQPAALEAAATAPSWPPDTGDVSVSAETQQVVNEFLSAAVLAETFAYTYSDPSYAAQVYAGEPLRSIQEAIVDLNGQGLFQVPEFDSANSHLVDIRVVGDGRIEVDTCEIWTVSYYRLYDGAFVGADSPRLTPQTITIERFSSGWFITNVAFYNPPSFCS
jgi:hypothetical protein